MLLIQEFKPHHRSRALTDTALYFVSHFYLTTKIP
jgi:hypothetical protein